MTAKAIKRIIDSPPPHWVGDGFFVRPMFDDLAFQNDISPFLMLDYAAPAEFGPSDRPPGVGPHPHKGFETVTIVYDGEVEHRDSAGNSGLISRGDVQWMTAGSGLLHEEFHSRAAAKRGGVVSMAQLWVNLPARDKSAPPAYQPILDHDIPRVALGEGGEARVIAGALLGTEGPARTFTPMNVWDVRLPAGGSTDLPLAEGHTLLVPVFAGSVRFNGGERVPAGKVALFDRKGDTMRVEALEDAKLLVLSGAPLNEPIAAYGPFVMNTEQEIRQAFADFRRGAMGTM